MRRGIVKWFDSRKGFGFITDNETGVDIFVHYSGISIDGYKTLKESERVTYDIADAERGKTAVNVKPE